MNQKKKLFKSGWILIFSIIKYQSLVLLDYLQMANLFGF